ncbi:MAG: DUF3179 domain-containing protein [Halalkalicoccus sp.]|nr:DUF3179 domain-containing protein [Halalkalicoccus sp.]
MRSTRRTLLGAMAGLGVTSLAGCLGGRDGRDGERSAGDGNADADLPTAETRLHLAHDLEHLRENTVSGGVSKDGIPSIDEPTFADAADVDLADGAPVFGVIRNGEARAYPQSVLVWHEIVNDTIGDEPIAVAYCPLTGTTQGFERGGVEFGVSGRLVNSNLVMYDRATDSRWPQVLATAIDGPFEDRSLREFRVVWTTWANWRDVHPETGVLTEETGYSRRYGSDPYGSYDPAEGYYASDNTIFSPLVEDDRERPKTVVIGTRTPEGALAFGKSALLESRVLSGELADTEYVAVADTPLETGYVYANPAGASVEPDGERYLVDGEAYDAADLPLDDSLAFDAMWFAWAGFYPDTGYVGGA